MTAVIATIIVILFLAFFVIRGWKKGFLRVILTTLSLVVTLFVASFLVTPVSDYLAENTQIEKNMEKRIEKQMGFDNKSDTQMAYDIETLEDIDDDAEREKKENEIIEELKLPVIVKDIFISKNTVSDYIYMGVDTFRQYVVRSIAMTELRIFTYIALVVAIYIIIRILLLVSKIISRIPVIKGINRILGGITGFIKGMLILWIIGLFVSLISQTPFGSQIVDVIHKSSLLTMIYDQNIIMKLIGSLFTLF